MFPLIAISLFLMALAPTVFADDRMYRCDDGTFTNRADLHCAPYELHGSFIIIQKSATSAVVENKTTDSKITVLPAPPSGPGNIGMRDHK